MFLPHWLRGLTGRRVSSSRRSARKGRPRRVEASIARAAEVLEDRTLLTPTLFIDYGDNFSDPDGPSGSKPLTLTTTLGAFRDVANDNTPANRILGTTLVDANNNFNAGTRLDIVAQPFSATDRAQMLAVIKRAYLPLNVNVVELTADLQLTPDGRLVAGATSMQDVVDTLRTKPANYEEGTTPDARDAYVFVGTFVVDPLDTLGPGNTKTYTGAGGLSPLDSNSLDTEDLISATNTHDDVAVVYSSGGFSLNTVNNIAHEAGHLFGLRHAITNNTGTPATDLFHQSEIMSYRNTSVTTSSMFSRFPMIQGDGNSPQFSATATFNAATRTISGPVGGAAGGVAGQGDFAVLGFIPGMQIVVSGTGAGNDGTYTVQSVTPATPTTRSTLTLTATAALTNQTTATVIRSLNTVNYNSAEARGGAITPFGQLVFDQNVGPNPQYGYVPGVGVPQTTFVSGTGAHDIITITRNGTNADVTVQAFGDAAYTAPAIPVPTEPDTIFSYSIPLTRPILVYGGDSDDRIVINGDLGVDVTIDGMIGMDSLVIDGQGTATAVYTPNDIAVGGVDIVGGTAVTDFGGTVEIGAHTITFNNFEVDFSNPSLNSSLTIQGVTTVTVTGSAGQDKLRIDRDDDAVVISGSINGVGMVPLTIDRAGNVNLIVNTQDSQDLITLSDLPDIGSILLSGGAGDDYFFIESLPFGTALSLFGGTGGDNYVIGHKDFDSNIRGTISVSDSLGSNTLTIDNRDDDVGFQTYSLTRDSESVGRFQMSSSLAAVTFLAAGTDSIVIRGSNTEYETFDIDYGGSLSGRSIDIFGNGSDDSFNLLASDADVTLDGGSGPNTYNIGDGKYLDNIGGTVTINGGDDGDELTIDDSTAPRIPLSTVSYKLDRESVNGVEYGTFEKGVQIIESPPSPVAFGPKLLYNAVESVTLDGSLVPDRFNVVRTLAGVEYELNGNDGSDTFIIADLDADRDGQRDENGDYDTRIRGAVTIFGGLGSNELIIADQADTGNDDYMLHNATVDDQVGAEFTKTSTVGNVPALQFVEIAAVTIDGSNANNTFDLDSVRSGVAVTLNGNDGDDTFNVGDGDFDTNIRGPLTIHGGDDSDTINLNDLADGPTGDSYTFDHDGATSTLKKPVQTLTFEGVEDFVLDASPNSDTINIDGLLSSVALTVHAGLGDDTINIGNGDFDTKVRGPVTVDGGDHTVADTIHVNDTEDGSGSDSYTFDRSEDGSTFSKPSRTLTFLGIEDFVLDAGPNADTIAIDAIPDVVNLTLNGGPPSTLPGDSLSITGTPDAIATYTIGATGAGEIVVGAQTISFTGIEQPVTARTFQQFTLAVDDIYNNLWVRDGGDGYSSVSRQSNPANGPALLRFADVANFVLDGSAIDVGSQWTIEAGAAAVAGLERFELQTGTGLTLVNDHTLEGPASTATIAVRNLAGGTTQHLVYGTAPRLEVLSSFQNGEVSGQFSTLIALASDGSVVYQLDDEGVTNLFVIDQQSDVELILAGNDARLADGGGQLLVTGTGLTRLWLPAAPDGRIRVRPVPAFGMSVEIRSTVFPKFQFDPIFGLDISPIGTFHIRGVTRTADAEFGSLRRAIERANTAPADGTAVVYFALDETDEGFVDVDAHLDGGDADPDVFVISPLSALPELTRGNTIINGASQQALTGDTNPNGPEITLAGELAGGAAILDGLVSHYRLDGSAEDDAGNNQPSDASGVSFVDAKIGQGVRFQPGGYIDIPQTDELTPQVLTLSAWVRSDGPGPNDDFFGSVIVGKSFAPPTGNTTPSVQLAYSTQTNRFLFGFGNVFTEEGRIVSAETFAPGEFYHVAGTYDGETFRLYVNGRLQGEKALAKTIEYYSTIPWTIGSTSSYYRSVNFPRTWNGVIDEVGIFDRALTAEEIRTLATPANGLVLGSSKNRVHGLNIQGFSGDGMLITGDDNTLTGNFIGTSAAGISAETMAGNVLLSWPTFAQNAEQIVGPPDGDIVTLADGASAEFRAFTKTTGIDRYALANVLGISEATLEKIDFVAFEQNGYPDFGFESSHWAFDDGTTTIEVTHIVGGGANGPIVKNGSIASSAFNSVFGSGAAGEGVSVGYLLFDFAGSGLDIGTANVTVTGGFGNTIGEAPDLLAVAVYSSATTSASNGGDGVHIVNASGNLVGGTTDSDRNVISGNSGNGVRIEGGAPLPSLVASWKAEGDATDSADDNDGEIVGAGFTAGARGGQAFQFDGVDDYIRVPNAPELEPKKITLSAWINAAGPADTIDYFVAKGGHLTRAASYALYQINGSVHFYIFDGDFTYRSPGISADTIYDGKWHQLTGTYDGGHVRLYVDGAEVGAGTATTAAVKYGLASSNDLFIGSYIDAFNGGTYNFAGAIDDVSLFGDALTAEQVGALYASGSPVVGGNRVRGNYIGTTADGMTALGNGGSGVYIDDSSGNLIGGTTEEARNLISANGTGVSIVGALASGNHVSANFVGLGRDGLSRVDNVDGVVVSGGASKNLIGGSSEAERNVISGNTRSGVFVTGTEATSIQGNYIGTDVTGTLAVANRSAGIALLAATDTLIGGTQPEAGNLISGNGVGIAMGATLATRAPRVEGNRIGTKADGKQALGNNIGIQVTGSAGYQVIDATIGGLDPNAGNVIAGNAAQGILVRGEGATRILIQGNKIGTDIDGDAVVRNGTGVRLEDAVGVTVGGDDPQAGNLIAGNYGDGIAIIGGSGHVVQSNDVGTNAAGNFKLGNLGAGISIINSSGNTIGGASKGNGNVVAFNGEDGIDLDGVSGGMIVGNYVGTDPLGRFLGNLGDGISLSSSTGVSVVNNAVGANAGTGVLLVDSSGNHVDGNSIGSTRLVKVLLPNDIGVSIQGGGANVVDGNVVSGNTTTGIQLAGTAGNTIMHNLVGLDSDGLTAIGNGVGVSLRGASMNTFDDNTISGNQSSGVVLVGGTTTGNRFFGNHIGSSPDGTVAFGNGGYGVQIGKGAQGNIIGIERKPDGTDDPSQGNTIAHNILAGVVVLGDGSVGNSIRGNSIDDNGGLGIDLAGEGPTANDYLDGDIGPNLLQNVPELSSVKRGAETKISGKLKSTPGGTFIIDFYASTLADPTGFGEGLRWLGSTTATADDNGTAPFNATVLATSDNEIVTATATDSAGNTSEFSIADIPKVKVKKEKGSKNLVAENAAVGAATTHVLTIAEVNPLLAQAGMLWRSAGFDVERLAAIDVRIDDLPGAQLGVANGRTITFDIDAAGGGWFVDPTPWEQSEFTASASGELVAVDPSPAAHYDLLTVAIHELGHALGLEHADGGAMDESLPRGMRRLPTLAEQPVDSAPDRGLIPDFRLDLEVDQQSAPSIAIPISTTRPKLNPDRWVDGKDGDETTNFAVMLLADRHPNDDLDALFADFNSSLADELLAV